MKVGYDMPPPKAALVEQGWSVFLVKVQNECGSTAPLRLKSPNAASTFNSAKSELRDRWLELEMFVSLDRPPPALPLTDRHWIRAKTGGSRCRTRSRWSQP